MKNLHKIQRVEICHNETTIHCPFCGVKTFDPEPIEEAQVGVCEHLLFMAHDEGFEFRSARFDKNQNLIGVLNDDIERGEKGFDGLTDQVDIPDSLKFACYQQAPSFFGAYFGYAPVQLL